MNLSSTLSIIGENFNPNHFKELIDLKISKAVYKGNHRHNLKRAKIMSYSFVEVDVCNNNQNIIDWNNFIDENIKFFNEHSNALAGIQLLDGLEYTTLEILVKLESHEFERFYFPNSLLHVCTKFNISLELSFIYQ